MAALPNPRNTTRLTMNCTQPVRINPLPECIESLEYNPFYLQGMIFTDNDTDMIAKVRDEATGKTVYIDFTTDNDGEGLVDITALFPLMNHVYTISFVNRETGNPEQFTVTNADSSTSTGCSIEFQVNIGQMDNNGYFAISSQLCPA